MNKKADTIVLETTIFIILNLVFIIILGTFAYNSGTKEFIYEQVYAKQIALLVDNSKPDMAILLDGKELAKLAKKNNKPLGEVISIDENTKTVKVNLKQTGGYSYKYFSDSKVSVNLDENFLSIAVQKKLK